MNSRISPADKAVFQRTIKSARLGMSDAQYEVGLMYANGIGVTQNLGRALDWVKQSAEKGFVPAQYLLATRYASGVAIEKNEHQAFVWFLRAADQGHAKAFFRLAKLHGSALPDAALTCHAKAADMGVPESQLALGDAFATGNGVAQEVVALLRTVAAE